MTLLFGLLVVGAEGANAQIPEDWRLEEVIRIGELDGALSFTAINDLVVVGDLLIVAQPQEHLIRVVSTDGDLRNVMGGRGQGPGEFQRIDHLAFVEGRLVAVDLSARRRTYFTLNGELGGTQRLPSPPIAPPLAWLDEVGEALHGRVVLTASAPARVSEEHPRLPAVLVDPGGDVIDTLLWFDPRPRGISARSATRTAGFPNPLYGGVVFTVSRDGSYFVTAAGRGDELEVAWYHTGRLERTTRTLRIPPVAVPKAYVERLTASTERVFAARGFTRGEIEDAVSFPEVVQGIDLVSAVSGGGVWLREPVFGNAESVWHFTSVEDERWIRVTADPSFRVLDQSDELVWGRVEDEFGVHYVVGLRLVRS